MLVKVGKIFADVELESVSVLRELSILKVIITAKVGICLFRLMESTKQRSFEKVTLLPRTDTSSQKQICVFL